MSTNIIDGKAFSQQLIENVKQAVTKIKSQQNCIPGLAVVLVGDNPASEIYVKNKVRQTEHCGMKSIEHRLPKNISQEKLIELVNKLNLNNSIDGILVQLPLPNHIDEKSIIDSISPEKDVDGFNVINVGLLSTGGKGLIPCTPLGCLLLLQDYFENLSGLNAVIVGRSNIVGKPLAQLLLKSNCTVTVAHSKTKNLKDVCKNGDILIAAIGRPEFISADWIKPGAVVIDVGINRLPKDGNNKSRLIGDVDFNSAANIAGAITPVPGGVGPMTIACLLRNTVSAFCKRRNFEEPKM